MIHVKSPRHLLAKGVTDVFWKNQTRTVHLREAPYVQKPKSINMFFDLEKQKDDLDLHNDPIIMTY